MKRSAAPPPPRDQDVTPFADILMRFCDSAPARAAIFVDSEGEAVDYVGPLPPFELRIMGAEWSVISHQLPEVALWKDTAQMLTRARNASFVLVRLAEGYTLVAQLPRYAFRLSQRATSQCVRELAAESGLPTPNWYRDERDRWCRVYVHRAEDDVRRPAAVWGAGAWRMLEVVGRVRGPMLRAGEQGFRVRTEQGQDLTLVREVFGRWFADQEPG